MKLTRLSLSMIEAVEKELRHQVARLPDSSPGSCREMIEYHMGWIPQPDRGIGGKRVRPLLLLLCNSAAGAEWPMALPAAAAIELTHNFTLVHDDIEDESETRRGQPTLWSRWGAALSVNAGDALFVLASRSILDLTERYRPQTVIRAAQLMQEAALALTQGQHLDMTYQSRPTLTIDEYWPMVSGKTAALLGVSAQIGAVLAGGEPEREEYYRLFGHHLGLAFQLQDDALGIWGDEAQTGKSAASDLASGKKTYPILIGVERSPRFASRWAAGRISTAEVPDMAALLASVGAKDETYGRAREHTEKALAYLQEAAPAGQPGVELRSLAAQLVQRDK